ncbi:MAG: M48 family peptidase, partial [Flavobacteriaceae bacterium]
MNTLFYIIIAILIIQFVLEVVLDHLNAKHYNDPIPQELDDVFDEVEYSQSQKYKGIRHRFGLVTSTFSLVLTLG